jgi:peptide/nickel transport system permease protein
MPWLWVPPGLMIALTVLCVNFVGDGLRDALDPQTQLG